MDKIIKELNDYLDCDNTKNQGFKKYIVLMQCNSIYRNSIQDHDFVKNPVDIISGYLMCAEAISIDNLKVLNVKMITDNQFKHVHEENNTDNNNFVCKSQVNQNYEKK